jgi:succinyl-CoA synthetase alpha subunit
VGIGGDPMIGSTFVDILRLFQQDPNTDLVVLIGEIGGSDEEEAAAYIGSLPSGERKPVVTFISGRSAPPGKRMGHAGAIISGGLGGPEAKVAAFRDLGLPVADAIPELPELARAALATRP